MDGKHLKPIKKQQSSSWKKYIQIKPQVLFSHGIITNPQPIQYIKPLKNIEKISWKIIHTEHKTPWGSYPLKIKKNYQWIQSIEFVMEDKSMVLDNKEKIDEWNYWQGFLWIPESNSLELAKLFFDNKSIFVFQCSLEESFNRWHQLGFNNLKNQYFEKKTS